MSEDLIRKPGSQEEVLDTIGAALGIGSAVRNLSTILTNITNGARREACLSAIERTFFTATIIEDGEETDECELRWNAEPDKYVEQFRKALAAITVYPSCEEANEVLGPCPHPQANSDGGHWWYIDHETENAKAEAGGSEDRFVECVCKSCPQRMRLSSGAEEFPI